VNYFDPQGLLMMYPKFGCDYGNEGQIIECYWGEAVELGGVSGRSSFVSEFPKCNKSNSSDEERNLNWIVRNYSSIKSVAEQASAAFGVQIDASWIFGWAARESGWGNDTSGLVKSNGNAFSQKTGANWFDQVPCPGGANSVFACFASFSASALSALFSPMAMQGYQDANGQTVDRPSAGFILADQLNRGSSLADAFQQVASGGTWGGWDRKSANYGSVVADVAKGVAKRIECLKEFYDLK
jgi:hypothetical protein